MKKKLISIIALCTATALIFTGCNTVSASEISEPFEGSIIDETESDSAMLVDSFFSDSTTTFVEGSKTVGDIVSGINDHTYAVDTATADTLANDIIADGDIITAITFDASDVDFDTVGEYTVVYRIFIDVEALNDYIEDNDIDDVDISDITSDSIDVCIPCTVSIVDEDIETTESADTTDSDDVIVVEINELTWTYEQVNSIPDVVSGIGSINPEDEDTDPEFDADVSIVDAVLYDMSSVDTEEPDDEDVAYYTYFDREALINYMEENAIDIEAYDGLIDTTTDYIMVYYGPITELALMDVINGLTDHYILVNSENIDYEYGITYDDDVVKNVSIDTEEVNTSEVGTYNIRYTFTIDRNALKDTKDNGTDEDLVDVVITKRVGIVNTDTADKLLKDGEVVWTDDNKSYGDTVAKATEDTAGSEDTAVAEDTADTTTTEDMQVATNDSGSSDSSGSSSSGSSGSSNSGSSGSSSSSGSSNSGSSSSGSSNNNSSSSGSSNNSSSGSSSSSSGSSSSGSSSGSSSSESVHTHSYTSSTTKEPTCESAGVRTYTCSCGASYTESIPATGHNWVEEYHEATGHYETVVVSETWTEYVVEERYICNADGYSTRSESEMATHLVTEHNGLGSYHVGNVILDTIEHPAETTQQWVQDSAAYTSYKCSKCGATK